MRKAMKKNGKKAEMGGREGTPCTYVKIEREKYEDTLIFIEVEYPFSARSLFQVSRILQYFMLACSLVV